MPQTVTGDDGKEIEVFTKEEVEEQVSQAISEKEEAIEEANTQLEEKNQALEDAKAELEEEKAKGKNANLGNLRKKVEKAEDAKSEVEKRLESTESQLAEFRKEQRENARNNYLEKSGLKDDAEFIKVFDTEFEKQGKDAQTGVEIQTALDNALAIAKSKVESAEPTVDPVRKVLKPHAPYQSTTPPNKDEESDASKNMRKDMNLSEDDVKKYGKDNPQKLF